MDTPPVFRPTHRTGSTLLEVMIVIAVLLALAVIFVPARSTSMGHHSSIMNNGRNIYVSIFARSLENPLDPVSAWPGSQGPLDTSDEVRSFPDSTAYFTWMVTNGVMNVDFSFFGAPGMPRAASTNPLDFTSAHNAWAVATGITGKTPDGTPVLFTANLSRDPGTHKPLRFVNETPYLIRGIEPLGGTEAIVIQNGGSAFAVDRKSLTSARFNPPAATNACIYPSAPTLPDPEL